MKDTLRNDISIKDGIWMACKELLATKKIDDIRTSEIIVRACVGRSTFYRKFYDKYDVVNYGLGSLYNACFSLHPGRRAFNEASLSCLISKLYDIRAVAVNAFSSRVPNNARQATISYLKRLVVHDLITLGWTAADIERHETMLHMYLIGVVDYLVEWLESPTVEPETVAAAVANLMPPEPKNPKSSCGRIWKQASHQAKHLAEGSVCQEITPFGRG